MSAASSDLPGLGALGNAFIIPCTRREHDLYTSKIERREPSGSFAGDVLLLLVFAWFSVTERT